MRESACVSPEVITPSVSAHGRSTVTTANPPARAVGSGTSAGEQRRGCVEVVSALGGGVAADREGQGDGLGDHRAAGGLGGEEVRSGQPGAGDRGEGRGAGHGRCSWSVGEAGASRSSTTLRWPAQ